MITITQKGLNSAIEQIDPNDFEDSIKSTIDEAAKHAEGHAKQICPQDTGKLQASIETQVQDDGFSISAHAERQSDGKDYAGYNEYGQTYTYNVGSYQDPVIVQDTQGHTCYRPFLRPAVYDAARRFPKTFGEKWYRKG